MCGSSKVAASTEPNGKPSASRRLMLTAGVALFAMAVIAVVVTLLDLVPWAQIAGPYEWFGDLFKWTVGPYLGNQARLMGQNVLDRILPIKVPDELGFHAHHE